MRKLRKGQWYSSFESDKWVFVTHCIIKCYSHFKVIYDLITLVGFLKLKNIKPVPFDMGVMSLVVEG